MKKLFHILGHAIFWLWNLTFLLVVYFGILPVIGIPLIQAIFAGEIESEFLVPFLGLIAIPTVCTLIGWWRLRKRPLELMRLFYGVEAPLFILCLVRLFALRELTPASTLLLGTVVVCILAFLFEVLQGYAERSRTVAWLQMAAHSLMLLVGVYVGVLLLFYAVPTAPFVLLNSFGFLREISWWIFSEDPLVTIFYLFTIGFSLLSFGFSATLFLGMPSTVTSLYLHSGHRILHRFAAQYGQKRAFQGAFAVLSVWMILFISLSTQPQIKAFQLLENPPQTDRARAELLRKSEVIRSGLVNAYLSSYRYVSPIEENDHIRVMYDHVFGLPEPLLQFLQNSYNNLMSPFLYNGSRSDSEKAAKLYAEFFDAPIQKAERKAVQRALQSTAILDEAKAGVLNINQKRVWLRSQNVTVQEHGDWADVELYEVYENQTTDVEEILYYFSLPESAAITGVWLGDTDNRETRFPFKVSPRGAAQKVYTSQVRRVRPVDPALLEQVGPRLYRLRAFPVPPKLDSWERRNSTERPTEMHLWLTYKVMRQEQGWPLPQLGEKRNIFWTEKTQRIQGGQAVKSSEEEWLPAYLPATVPQQPILHQVNFPNGYRLTAKPMAENEYSLPKGQRFAVILDSSRSMAKHTQELTETFNWLKKHGFADNTFANNDADLYVTASSGTQPERIDDIRGVNPTKMMFYGTLQHKEMLRQFDKLRGDTPYDGILLVTDEGSYELSDNSKDVPAIPAPLWMVHLGSLPPAYDDATLQVIQGSKGGISTKLTDVLQRQATQATLGSSVIGVVDGYAWSMEKVETPDILSDETGGGASVSSDHHGYMNVSMGGVQQAEPNGFESLAARQMVTGLSQEIEGNPVAQLDAIHAIAKTYQIVTPYSSMIVLVNDEQREALRQAEAQKDRFERKVEDGNQRLTQPNNPMNRVSVPEPRMVVGLVAIALILVSRSQRGKS